MLLDYEIATQYLHIVLTLEMCKKLLHICYGRYDFVNSYYFSDAKLKEYYK